jgi:hypothetical protein
MTKFKKKEVHPQILRSYLDVKHDRWFWEYYPYVMIGSMLGAIGIVALVFVLQPRISIGALMILGALLLTLTPHVAMFFLAPGRQRRKILIGYTAAIVWLAIVWGLLSWLAPNGHF